MVEALRQFNRDLLTLEPGFNLPDFSYFFSTIVHARRLSRIAGNILMEDKKAEMIRSFSEPGIPVIIRALNEAEALPKLLYALSRSSVSVNPIIIDNGSSDGTQDIAESLELPVLVESAVGLVNANIAAFKYIRERSLDFKPVLFLDADGIPGSKWAESLVNLLSHFEDKGGIVYGMYVYYGGQVISDFILSLIYPTLSVATYIVKHKITAHGGNFGIKFDSEGRILASCVSMNQKVTIGTGGLMRDSIRDAGGIAVRSFSPYSLSSTESDRMPDLLSVMKLILTRRKSLIAQYQNWFEAKPGVDYNERV